MEPKFVFTLNFQTFYGFKFGLARGLEVLKKYLLGHKNMHMWKVAKMSLWHFTSKQFIINEVINQILACLIFAYYFFR